MTINRLLRRAVPLAAALLLLSGCGQSSSSTNDAANSVGSSSSYAARQDVSFMQSPGDAPEEGTTADGAYERVESTVSPLPQDGRKRVQYANLTLETREFDTALTQLEQLVTATGGYMDSQRVDGRSIYAQEEYYQRTATLSARIPAEKLDEVMAEAGKLCNVTSTRTSVDDITERYTDTETRLKTLQVQEARLLELLSKAETVEDMLTIESRLSDIRYNIEALTGQKQKMDQQVAYSYLNLTLEEVVEYQKAQQKPATFGEKLSASLGRSGRNLTNTFQGLLFFLIEEGPLLVIYGGLLLLIFAAARKINAAWRRRHPAVSTPRPSISYGGWGPVPIPKKEDPEPSEQQPPAPPEK